MVFRKVSKRILLVGNEGVVLFAPSGKGVEREMSISWNVPNFEEQLTEVLSENNKGKALVILFDGADQAYRKETNVPKLSPFDRPRFVKRKLELAFPAYPVRAALEIKPPGKKGGFKLELTRSSASAKPTPSYLFVAIPELEQLDRVANAVFESGVQVAGFGLLPVESTALVTTLKEKIFGKATQPSEWTVLIGQNETGGLRQIIVRNGQLAMTRMTPMSEAGASGPEWVTEVTNSFRETLAYVSRFGYTPEAGLDVIILCNDIEKQFFNPEHISARNFKCVSTTQALSMLGTKSFGFEQVNFADALHAAWVGKKRALTLPVRVPGIHKVQAPRLFAQLAAALLLASALGVAGWAAKDYNNYLTVKDGLRIKEITRQAAERDYQEESKVFDDLPIHPDIIKNKLSIKELLEKNTADVAVFLNRLYSVLGANIQLTELQYTHAPSAALSIKSAGPRRFTPQIKKEEERGKITAAFKFSLPKVADLEQRVTRSEQLLEELQAAFPGYEVRMLSQFGDVNREGAFQGQSGDEEGKLTAEDDVASFKLEGAPL